MAIRLDVYNAANDTLQDSLDTARRIKWLDDLTGSGQLTFLFDADAESSTSLVQIDRVIRVYDTVAAADLFAGTVRRQVKSRGDDSRAEVMVSCDGLRGLLANAVVYQPALGGSIRLFGWQTPALYDDSAWTAPISHGTQGSDPFGDGRPQDWPTPTAEYIWDTHTGAGFGTAAAGDCYFRKEFSTSTAQDVVVCATADDEFTLYVDGVEMLSSTGAYQWDRYQQAAFSLPAGDHLIAIRGRNFQRNGSDSVAWVLAAIVAADPDGQPAQTNETWEVYSSATGGTFTLSFDAYGPTNPIAYNASAATVKTELDALVASIDVSVTGTGTSGDPWVIVCDGDEIAGTGHTITGDGSLLTPSDSLTLTNTVDGAYADVVVKTDTTWLLNAYPATAPGLSCGAVLKTLIDEAQTRGALGTATYDFTATVDSDSVSWTDEIEVGVPVGSTVEQVVRILEDSGCDIHVTPTGVVQAFEDKGSDLSATVQVEYAVNASEVIHIRDGYRIDRLLIETPEGWAEKEVASPGTPEREAFAQAGAFPTAAAFDVHATQLLADYDSQADTGRFGVPSESSGVQPYDDFVVGDTIGATDWQNSVTKQRVLAITANVDDGTGAVDWTVETDDTGVAAPSYSEAAVMEHDGGNSTTGDVATMMWQIVPDVDILVTSIESIWSRSQVASSDTMEMAVLDSTRTTALASAQASGLLTEYVTYDISGIVLEAGTEYWIGLRNPDTHLVSASRDLASGGWGDQNGHVVKNGLENRGGVAAFTASMDNSGGPPNFRINGLIQPGSAVILAGHSGGSFTLTGDEDNRTLSFPAIVEGDLLVFAGVSHSATAQGPEALPGAGAVPDGSWTSAYDNQFQTAASNNRRVQVFWKVADADDETAGGIDFYHYGHAVVQAWRFTNATTVVGATAGTSTDSAPTITLARTLADVTNRAVWIWGSSAVNVSTSNSTVDGDGSWLVGRNTTGQVISSLWGKVAGGVASPSLDVNFRANGGYGSNGIAHCAVLIEVG